jgi:hypothetical protein
MEFILSRLNTSSSSSNEELLEDIAIDDRLVVQVAITCQQLGCQHFMSTKFDEKSGELGNPDVVCGTSSKTMRATPSLFKSFTDFTWGEFEELSQLVVPTIISHARSIGESHHIYGQPSKLAP